MTVSRSGLEEQKTENKFLCPKTTSFQHIPSVSILLACSSYRSVLA